MLGSIRQTHRIHSNPSSRQRYPARNNTTQSSGMFFAATQPEEKKVAESSHKNFLDMPPELLKNIGDFLGSKEVLSSMLPLSRKAFQIIFDENFKLRIPMNTRFLKAGHNHVMEIGYEELLSNKILELKKSLGNIEDLIHGSALERDIHNRKVDLAVYGAALLAVNVGLAMLPDSFVPTVLEGQLIMFQFATFAAFLTLCFVASFHIDYLRCLHHERLQDLSKAQKKRLEQRFAQYANLKSLEKHLRELVQLYKSVCNKQLSKY